MMRNFLIIAILFAFSSCEEDGKLLSPVDSDALTESLVSSDGLTVSRFIEDGRDKTASLDSYLFFFMIDGAITVNNNEQEINGSYSVFMDDGELELMMSFPSSSNLNELTDDWYFISQTQEVLRFEDSGDVLEFTIK